MSRLFDVCRRLRADPPVIRGLSGRRTVSRKVSGLALGVIAGWLVLLATGFALVLSSRVSTQIDDALRVRAQAASATVVLTDGRVSGVRESSTDSVLDSSIWVYRATTILIRPTVSEHIQRRVDQLVRSSATQRRQAEAAAHDRRFLALPVDFGGRRIGTVVAAIDTGPYENTKDLALAGTVIVAGLLLVVAYPVLRLATSRAMRPVEVMTRRAADWSVTAPGQRFGPDQRYAELQSLAGTLDRLLDRVAGVLRHERQLSAELSHELRTPLSCVMGELDLLLEQLPEIYRPALRTMRDSCTAMDTIIDTLLSAARAELVPTVGHTPLTPVLDSFAARNAIGTGVSARGDRAARTGRGTGGPVVRADSTDLSVGVDAQVVARTLSPIVENALRYARTEVRLHARSAGSTVAITVSNDGPSLSADLAERVFEPGFSSDLRLDDREVAAEPVHQGAGLGLSLARRLARAADGDVTVETVETGGTGTTFLITLPAG